MQCFIATRALNRLRTVYQKLISADRRKLIQALIQKQIKVAGWLRFYFVESFIYILQILYS